MRFEDLLQLGSLLALLAFWIRPFGLYLQKVLNPAERTFLDPLLKPLERFTYRLLHVDPLKEQNWRQYLISLLHFSWISLLFTFLLIALQHFFPLNPEKFTAPSWDLNFNTAMSFMTNTNWQSYSGETTLSYLSQMAALAVQNFVSPAVGLAAAATLVRGLSRDKDGTVGNFWADLVRLCYYLFLPLAFAFALLFISQGIPQNFDPYTPVETLEGGVQTIAQGPIASQEAIKLLGTNGGGFFGANSAHPYENPNPLVNLFEMFLILILPISQIDYFGRAMGKSKHAWCIIASLAVLFIAGVLTCACCEERGNPHFQELNLFGGNMEGKEARFGTFTSALFACVTTAVSCGAVNCEHDSLTPIGGMIPMLNMQLSEVIFGGDGAGLYSVLLFVFLSIFIAGLIIGRTPEYLGKKIETFDIKMTVFAVLSFVLVVHTFTALACFTEWGLKAVSNGGPHGFSEILYAYSSAAANNGSAFAGLSSNSLGYNITLALAMLLGRFLVLIPVVALAGSFVQKKKLPEGPSSFPVSSFLFICLLIGVILLIGALTFLPALIMGPILESFFFLGGTLFS